VIKTAPNLIEMYSFVMHSQHYNDQDGHFRFSL